MVFPHYQTSTLNHQRRIQHGIAGAVCVHVSAHRQTHCYLFGSVCIHVCDAHLYPNASDNQE